MSQGQETTPPPPFRKAVIKTSEGLAAPKAAANAGLVPHDSRDTSATTSVARMASSSGAPAVAQSNSKLGWSRALAAGLRAQESLLQGGSWAWNRGPALSRGLWSAPGGAEPAAPEQPSPKRHRDPSCAQQPNLFRLELILVKTALSQTKIPLQISMGLRLKYKMA